MDVLSDAIAAMRIGRPHSSRSVERGPWGIRFPSSDGAGFHVVLQGSAWLLPPAGSGAAVALGPGDIVFMAHGNGHGLAGHPETPLEDAQFNPDGSWIAPPRPDGPVRPGDTLMMCGAYQLDRRRAHPLLSALPPYIHLPARVGTHDRLRSAVDLLGAELADPQPGSDAIVPALLDSLLLYLLRTWWLTDQPDCPAGWAGALSDPAVVAALRALHDDPARPWTVEELGARAGLSRAAFARRFTTLVGQPPLTYLTWWRMTLAGRALRTGDAPLRVLAQQAGYTSEFAFAKAFKREYGVAPGHYRKQGAPLTRTA
ncbi:AraC family transcriptional regulator [Streptomyces sp. YC504]|uniref:AraC family transcriptional regulator n=1 Tax=Streptomyces mesophilus TaxID=1775132 RepID=A0A6G4XNT1_9ACTN|nr:AraC family transcriptional regulator [Streptomyces mesophilus]NGO79236.1 AraC family transcriptional regulator [Streptomyces mesophilus]